MSGRPRLHYHSDCDFFAGCENMIANFLKDERLQARYDVSFSFRWSERYEAGLRARVPGSYAVVRYPLVAGNVISRHAQGLPKPLGLMLRALNYLLLVRYWVLAWNVLVLYRAWRGRGIDLLHINNGGYPAALSCLAASIAGRLAGIGQIVMVVNNIAVKGRYRYWWLDRAVDYFVGKSVTRFVTGSRHAGKALQEVLRLPDVKFATVHNGIAPRQSTESRSETRARLGVAPGALVFGMVALLEWRKGHRVLLEAVSQLRSVVSDDAMPVFLIEGEGPDRAQLAQIIERTGVGNWVRLIGSEAHIFSFMQALDVMLLPSVANEDFPNVILEAMSLGKPVIASRLAGTPEQLIDAVTGALVAPGDAAGLARAIASFIQNRQRLLSMGEQGRARFEENFTASVAVTNYMNLYQDLLSRRKN